MSSAADLTQQLADHGPRPAGSDAERRAAAWLATQINQNSHGRFAELEPFWSRPSWIVAQLVHIALAVVGSLLAPTQPKIGASIIFIALICMVSDWVLGISPGRYLSFERASQNVVAPPVTDAPVRLVITAGYDTTRLDMTTHRRAPGWMFWLLTVTVWLLAMAFIRVEENRTDAVVAVLQIIPTVGLIIVAAGLLLVGRSAEDAGGAATAVALVRTLDAAPPVNLAVELVLTGTACTYGTGLRRYLRARRRHQKATNTIVLGFSGGEDGWYLASDGPFIPLSYFRELKRLAADTGMLSERVQRGCGPALPGRMRQLPALTLGGDPDTVLSAGLILVEEIDAYVGGLSAT